MSVLRYERVHHPLAGTRIFLARVGVHAAIALIIVAVITGLGRAFFYFVEGEPEPHWTRAYAQAALLVSGMGPMGDLRTPWGQAIGGTYALFSGFFLIGALGVIAAPFVHRLLHYMLLD